jgi:uncharacterized membrane protein YqjE
MKIQNLHTQMLQQKITLQRCEIQELKANIFVLQILLGIAVVGLLFCGFNML